MKCTFAASSTCSFPSISSNSLPGSVSSKDCAADGPPLPPPGSPALLGSSLLGRSYRSARDDPHYLSVEEQTFLRGLSRSYSLSTNTFRATEGSGSNVLRRVQLLLLVKAMLPSAPSSPPANALHHPPDGCRLVHASGKLRSPASFTGESRLRFGGLCHTAGRWQRAGNNAGTQAETFTSHWKAFFFFFAFPKCIPPPKRKANTMLISSEEISPTFSPATDQGAKPISHCSHGAEHLHARAKAAPKSETAPLNMDTAETKLVGGYCCSREQPLPREIMKTKTATGRATVGTEPDDYRYIRWESSLEAQHPPSRMGEKPSASCSAKRCGHWRACCTCPSSASLPTSTHAAPALWLLPADSQPSEQENEPWYRNPGPPSPGRTPLHSAHEPNQTLSFSPHPSVESHSAVTACLKTPLSWLKILHLQITTFWDACKAAGRADDSVELKLPETKRWQADGRAGHWQSPDSPSLARSPLT